MSETGKRLIKSFSNASRGIAYLFNSQINARIELIITILVIISGIYFNISHVEWLVILLCIALVLGLEGVNTALETLSNKLHPGFDREIGKTKDIAAGAVLIASIFAAIIGFVIFVPRFLNIFTNY